MRSISGILRKNNRKIVSKRSLRCETLEDRRVLATFTVLNTNDAGAGSLRQAIIDSNAAAGADTIDFAAAVQGATINLTTLMDATSVTGLVITDDLAIDASAGARVTISGNNTFRIFKIDDGAATDKTVSMKNVQIQGGNTTAEAWTSNFATRRGGGIDNREALTLDNVVVTNNVGRRGGGVSSSGPGDGTRRGSLTILNSVISGNSTNNDPAGGAGNVTGGRGGGIGLYQSSPVIIRNTTIEGNNALTLGAGIDSSAGVDMTIENTTIRNNVAGDRGGAVYTSQFALPQATITRLTNVTISGNTTPVLAHISAGQGATVIMRNTTVENNLGPVAAAGAYSSTVASTLDVEDSIIRNNEGGGLDGTIFTGATAQSAFRLVDSEISGNGFLAGGGRNATTGGIALGLYNALNALVSGATITGNYSNYAGTAMEAGGNATVTMENSTISNNISGNFSGGVSVTGSAVLTINRSTFNGNIGEAVAGAIHVGDNGTVNLNQSTLSGNSSFGDGGGALVYGDSGYTATLNISGSTITGNTSDTNNDGGAGGGLFVAAYADPNGVANGNAVVTITNSIISGNTDTSAQGADIFDYKAYYGGAAGYTTAKFSFIGDNENSGLAEANPDANGNIVGGAVGGVLNANLGPLANNGGSTRTHLPNAGSPVINVGDPAVVGGTDQRGLARVFGGRVDMGSVEVQPAGIDADFNDDGLLNCADIDALTNAVAMGGSVATFDLNGDGSLSILDVDKWRADAGAVNIGAGRVYKVGDANLDGGVDGSDFGIWNANKFTANKDWCRGNFNADGVTDGSDFGLWNANKFTSSDAGRSATAGGLIHDDVAPVGGQSAAARVPGAGKLSAEVKSKKPVVAAAREEAGVARRVRFAPPTAAAIESKTETPKVSLRTEETKVVALPTLHTSVNSGSDSARNSTSRLLKKVASHDNFFSMFGAQ
jgi:hypothetical protein